MNFENDSIKSQIVMWVHNTMINENNDFKTYETLESYIRNHMSNEITRFISCNRTELSNIFNHYKKV